MQDAICREHDATRALPSVVGGSKEASEHELSHAVYADSFIREVLWMKPDAVNAARVARKDTELAGYFIPKGIMPPSHGRSASSANAAQDPSSFP